MAWQEINITDAKINMSKVQPYDETLSILEKKQGYYHNNRLTPLSKWTTSNAIGYKCYKRKANPNNLIDDELTDYIEVNKITESGSLVHMIDVADSYYKLDEESTKNPVVMELDKTHLILNDIDLGPREAFKDYCFTELEYKHLLVKTPEKKWYLWNYDSKYTNRIIISDKDDEKFRILRSHLDYDECLYLFTESGYNEFRTKRNDILKAPTIPANDILNSRVEKKGNFYAWRLTDKTIWLKEIEQSVIWYRVSLFNPTVYIGSADIFTMNGKFHFEQEAENRGSGGFDERIVFKEITNYLMPFYNVGDYFIKHFVTTTYPLTLVLSDDIQPAIIDKQTSTKWSGIFDNKLTMPSSNISLNFNTTSTPLKTNNEEIISSLSDLIFYNNYNESRTLENGFVLNFLNRFPTTIGHNYKVIVRLDTQGIDYLGSDNTGVYIKDNSKYYKVSIQKMYPDVGYDEEVNIIENANYCQQVNGYKIFNTTTYYNAIYNDDKDKVICSCDDWNSRIVISSSQGDNFRKATSRVGNFWNSTQSWSDIPNKAISDEQVDFDLMENPTFTWSNPNYTMHKGTEAYLYYANDTQKDTMYQQYKIDKDGFTRDYSEKKEFVHNSPYQLVPSILFTQYLKSDVENIIQINSESYRLKTYAYSATTPALVYQSTAESININPNSEEMVLQGSYYNISGSNDRRIITNPYDTSTTTYCCDVTGLKYIGYDSIQGYFYSPSTSTIYTFNGANKLNAYIEVDNKIPLNSTDKAGITVCNIPSINLVAMAFTDGVLLIVNQQSVFIPQQTMNNLSANREYGVVRVNGDYYYFGTNSNIKSLIASTGGKSIIRVDSLPSIDTVEDKDNTVYQVKPTQKYYVVEKVLGNTITYKWTEITLDSLIGSTTTDKLILKTSKIGIDRKTNVTMSKQRICVYSDKKEKSNIKVTITSRLGDKINTETYTKIIYPNEFIDNEYQWEFNQKHTKANWYQIEAELDNLDLLNYYIETSDRAEENLVRK